jgi:hypothetical protein
VCHKPGLARTWHLCTEKLGPRSDYSLAAGALIIVIHVDSDEVQWSPVHVICAVRQA